MNRLPVALVCLILLLGARASALRAEPPLAMLAEGEPFRGTLVRADANGTLRFDVGGMVRSVPMADLVLWGHLVEPRRGAQVVLVGGGIVCCEAPRIEREQLRASSEVFENLSLPLGAVAGVVLRPPLEPAARDQLLGLLTAPGGQTDRVLLDNGDELTGTLAGLDERLLRLETDAGTLDLELEKVSAVMFNPALADPLPSGGVSTLVGFRDGSRLQAAALVADKAIANIQLPGGAALKTPLDTIVALQPLDARATYLSDLKPASYRHIPYLELAWPYHTDRSVLGSQMRAGGHVFAKGLGMHSPARITFDLDRPYRAFQAELAIDDEAGPHGSAVFRVFTDDGSGNWQPRFSSATIRGGQPPVSVSVDLAGAKRISLLVDFSDRGDEWDHADWLNARLVR